MKLHNKGYKNLGVIILLLLTLTCSVNTKIDDASPEFESSLPNRQTEQAPLPSPENRQTSNSVPLTIRELSVPNIIDWWNGKTMSNRMMWLSMSCTITYLIPTKHKTMRQPGQKFWRN